MQKEIIQKKGFITREAKILETKIVYKSKTFGQPIQMTIPYEDLSRSKEAFLLNRVNFYVPVITLGLLTAGSFFSRNDKDALGNTNEHLWIVFAILFSVSVVIYLMSLERLWRVRINFNTYLLFFRDKPNSKVVDEFIESLFEARDIYLRKTYYLEPNINSPFENQKSNLQLLRKMEVISAEEFQSSINKLEEVFKRHQHFVRFN
jgi:hypothetical protein